MFQQALRVAVSLALFRSGPEEMPYSPRLTRAIVLAAVLVVVLMLSPVTPLPLAVATGVGGAAGMAVFLRRLLAGRGLINRFEQALASQLLVGVLFALAMWPAFAALAPLMQELMKDPQALEKIGRGEPLPVDPPAWAGLWSDVLFIWSLAASARINRLAAGLTPLSGWLQTVLSLFVLLGFVLVAQILVAVLSR